MVKCCRVNLTTVIQYTAQDVDHGQRKDITRSLCLLLLSPRRASKCGTEVLLSVVHTCYEEPRSSSRSGTTRRRYGTTLRFQALYSELGEDW